jgi:Transmembrane secretion effector
MFDTRPLRSTGFRHLAAAYWVNEFGNWIGEIALTILVYDRTRSPLGTAALFLALRFLPALLAPLLTTRVETLRPRDVLTVLYVLEAVLFACIAVVTRHFSLPAVLVLATLDGALAVTAKALTRSATANDLIKHNLLREGNGIMNLGAMASTACSPLIAGGLVAWKGAESALLVDAGTFLVTALIVVTARGIHVESDAAAGSLGRMRNGLHVLRTRGAVRRLMGAIGFAILLSAVPIPIEVVFVKQTLHAGDSGYGFLLGSWGIGMVIGGAAFAGIGNVRLTALLGVGTFVIALGYGGLALAPTLAAACAASVVGGAGNGAAWIAAVTSVQERIPLDTQSAVMSVLEGMNQVMPALGFVAGGALTALTSPRLAYGVAAVGVAAVVMVTFANPIDRVKLSRVEYPDTGDLQEDRLSDAQENDTSRRTPSVPSLTIG